jgi:NAD(P)-dependent dehydrogenase (short-subunit alcohol dehydrogenase family)
MLSLAGKTAVVTGAGSGIGRGIALALARAGADVLCADIAPERGEESARMVRDLGRKSLACVVDVRKKADVVAMAERAGRELGSLDICVANAGIGRGGSVLTMTEEDWDTLIDVNLTGVFLTVQACAREMVRHNRGGRIIAISSLAAERPVAVLFAYCATKAGVRMMCRCWAQELAPFGITVNSIGPGVIDTPLAAGLIGEGEQRARYEQAVPMGRVGYPEDIGRLACWLASNEAEYVTGTYNLIDGGLGDRAGFGTDSPQGQMQQLIREARGTMSGEELLGMIDARAAERLDEITRERAARGLQ